MRLGAAAVLPGAQLQQRQRANARKRGRGLHMDDSGDMGKVFGMPAQPGAPRRGNRQLPLKPGAVRRVPEVPQVPAVRRVPELPPARGASPAPLDAGRLLEAARNEDLSNVDRAMDLLVGNIPPGSGGPPPPPPPPPGESPTRVRALEQRLGFLEAENNTLRDALGTQMNSLMDKIQQSEARMLGEVQRRVELELEVRDKQQTAAVAEAKAGRRLTQLERLVESQQAEISDMAAKLSRAQQRLETIPAIHDRVDTAVMGLQKDALEKNAVDASVAHLQAALRKRDKEGRETQERENRKGAVLFGEVTRLGKAIEAANGKTDRALSLMQKRFEAVESRLKADERGIIAMEGRDAEKFEGLARRAEQLEKYLVELSDMSLKQREELDAEASRRKLTQEEQTRLVGEVRGALAKSDSGVSQRLTQLMQQIGEQLVAEREKNAAELRAAREDASLKEQTGEERAAVERQHVAARFEALEQAIRDEASTRHTRQSEYGTETERRITDLSTLLAQEVADRSREQATLEDSSARVQKEARSSLDEFQREATQRLDSLEEVVRTEIKSRMRGQEKVHAQLDQLRTVQSAAVGRARTEAAKMLDQANHGTNTRLQRLEEAQDRISRESLMALSKSTQSQALLNADLGGRLDALEQRELAEENNTEQIQVELTGKIEQFSRANTDAIGALQSVVADHRRENEEGMAKLQADVERELAGSSDSMRQAMTNLSSDLQGEVEKLREETSKGMEEAREATRAAFDEAAASVQTVSNEAAKLRAEAVDAAKLQGAKERAAAAESAAYRDSVAADMVAGAVAGAISDMVTYVENEDMVATIGAARRQIDAIASNVLAEAQAACAVVDGRVSALDETQSARAQALEDGVAALREDTETRLAGAAAAGVADKLAAKVVEDDLDTRIAGLRGDLDRRLAELEAAEGAKLKKVDDSLQSMQDQIAAAATQQGRLESRVESVVGQIEEEKNNAEREWLASVQAAQEEDDAEADLSQAAGLGGSAGGSGGGGGQKGSLPVADVGFPPPSDA